MGLSLFHSALTKLKKFFDLIHKKLHSFYVLWTTKNIFLQQVEDIWGYLKLFLLTKNFIAKSVNFDKK